jgi:competence ComEA-like helix-hairpin-helix protein
MTARILFATVAAAVTLAAASARADPAARIVPPVPSAAAPSITDPGRDGVVNLNSAAEDKLTLLPGIGPRKAQAIVEHRRAHPFRRTDELVKVKGIGRKLFGRDRSRAREERCFKQLR